MISTQPKTITMVPFDYSEAHYEVGVRLNNSVWPEVPDTVADWKLSDANRQVEHFRQRFLIQESTSQEYVGYAVAMHTSWTFHPHRFMLNISIAPEHQGRGYGKQAYEFLLDLLAPFDPMEIEGDSRRDRPRGIRFLEDRSFELKTVEYSSRLELANFDPTAYGNYNARMVKEGIEIINLNDLKARAKNYHRIIYDLLNEIDKDVPWHHVPTPQPFDLFVKRFDSFTDLIPETYLLAVDGDQYVGVTMLFKNKIKDDTLFTGLTGVLRTHRRKGIAMALKLRALGYAKQHFRAGDGSIPVIITENEENNPMFMINERLGFEREPDWVSYVKTIRPERMNDVSDPQL